MDTLTAPFVTPEEYLASERAAEHKSEYLDGEIIPMSGASFHHTIIAANIIAALNARLRESPCTVHPSDLRICVSPTGLYTYPDVVVVCGEPEFADDKFDMVLNPALIVEVLSESTKDYDRGGKFAHYRTLDSLQDYVLVAQDAPHAEHYGRQPEGRWLLSETKSLDGEIELTSLDVRLPLDEIYRKVNFSNA